MGETLELSGLGLDLGKGSPDVYGDIHIKEAKDFQDKVIRALLNPKEKINLSELAPELLTEGRFKTLKPEFYHKDLDELAISMREQFPAYFRVVGSRVVGNNLFYLNTYPESKDLIMLLRITAPENSFTFQSGGYPVKDIKGSIKEVLYGWDGKEPVCSGGVYALSWGDFLKKNKPKRIKVERIKETRLVSVCA